MEGPRCSEISESQFRFPSFHAKMKEGEGLGGFGGSFHGVFAPPPPNASLGALGFFGHSSQVKGSFSIDALLGLTDRVRDDNSPKGPLLLNYHHSNSSHFEEEGSKVKLGQRYVPYKRERKGHQQHTQGSPECKEVLTRGGKAKRVRTIFTPEQLEKLESEFERQQYMVGTERSYLAESLDLTEAQVKVWFQNRRIKWRKVHLEMQQERLRALRSQETPELESSSDSNLSQLESSFLPRSDRRSDETGGPEGGARDRRALDMDRTTGWDGGGGFDMDAYLLKTLASVGPSSDWTSPQLATSESESESE